MVIGRKAGFAQSGGKVREYGWCIAFIYSSAIATDRHDRRMMMTIVRASDIGIERLNPVHTAFFHQSVECAIHSGRRHLRIIRPQLLQNTVCRNGLITMANDPQNFLCPSFIFHAHRRTLNRLAPDMLCYNVMQINLVHLSFHSSQQKPSSMHSDGCCELLCGHSIV